MVGSVTTKTLKIRVCKQCGYGIDDTGLCSNECAMDGEPRRKGTYLIATYERRDTFLGDED